MDVAISIGIPIRLTTERWFHIIENHDDLAGYYDDVISVVESPDLIIPGHRGSKIAVRSYGRIRYLMVAYRELIAGDGFVVTAYFARTVDRKKALWTR